MEFALCFFSTLFVCMSRAHALPHSADEAVSGVPMLDTKVTKRAIGQSVASASKLARAKILRSSDAGDVPSSMIWRLSVNEPFCLLLVAWPQNLDQGGFFVSDHYHNVVSVMPWHTHWKMALRPRTPDMGSRGNILTCPLRILGS